MMRSEKGTYAVIFQCRSKATQQVGQWGMISLREGYYVYVGSAFGPGGVKARVSHHYHNTKKPHWHIDYLRRFMCPVTVWYTYDHRRLEHRWAKVFLKMNNMSPFQGFGCSDCDKQNPCHMTCSSCWVHIQKQVDGVKGSLRLPLRLGLQRTT